MTGDQLHSIRWRVHLVLAVALLASVAANVLAAEATVVARSVAAWPPIALLLVVDVLGRVPTSSGIRGRLAVTAAAVVALVAAVASFSHVRDVALEVGESELVAWILPLSVDGLAVVCSVALIEINHRLRATSGSDADLLIADAVPESDISIPPSSSPSSNGAEAVSWM